MIECICKECGIKFWVKPSQIKKGRKYCSKKCYDKSQVNKVECICKGCGEKFLEILSKVKQNKNNFCSSLCYHTSRRGIKFSEDHRRKISESNKGKIVSIETCKRMSVSKQNISLETREKISKSNKGKKHSVETKLKMSVSRKGKGNNFFGKNIQKNQRRK